MCNIKVWCVWCLWFMSYMYELSWCVYCRCGVCVVYMCCVWCTFAVYVVPIMECVCFMGVGRVCMCVVCEECVLYAVNGVWKISL